MQRGITPEDVQILGSFRGQWRAAGWGVVADCHTDVDYGFEYKFIAGLFLPSDYDRLLDEQHEATLEGLRGVYFSPMEIMAGATRRPIRQTELSYERVFDTPNLVHAATAVDAVRLAFDKARQQYPGQVPSYTSALCELAEANFGHTPLPPGTKDLRFATGE